MTPPATVRIPVRAGAGYDVVVGTGALSALGEHLGRARVSRVAVVSPPAVRELAGEVCRMVAAGGSRPVPVEIPDGEAAKEVDTAARVWAALGAAGCTREDPVVAVGGGATTDLAGFVAATWLRGVPLILVPTTLLAMVDAAIGGKTAVNTATGKNLVGAFHQPALVVVDPGALRTLPQPDFLAGLAEVVKAGFIADPAILELVESDPGAVARRSPGVLTELVQRSIRVKADVVSADPTELGRREVLNYGHTLGHAIEADAGYGRWRHGDAVAVGLCYAAAVARRRADRPLDAATADRHRSVLDSLGLPSRYSGDWPRLRRLMSLDKKARGERLRLVLLEGLAHPTVVEALPEGLLEDAYREVSA